jgi:hypothetical protein
MNTEYEIRASSPSRIPAHLSIGMSFALITGGGGLETRVIVSLPRSVLQDWDMEWPGSSREIDPQVARLVGRLGLQMIESSLRSGKEVPPNLQITAEVYGYAKPKFVKSCLYQGRRETGLFCTVADLNDPGAGATTDILCAGCQMPDKALVCSELMHVKTTWLREGAKLDRRKVVHAECNAGHELRTGANCMPGLQECWLRRLELHS